MGVRRTRVASHESSAMIATQTPRLYWQSHSGGALNDHDFQRVERLFQSAADLPENEREPFLEKECSGEPELYEQVTRLLARLDETFDTPTRKGWGPYPRPALSEGPGSMVDRYKLLQVIGEGGFGVVYMAEQQEPVVRKVALKVIKLGMDTREVVARFEAERQALAMMDHPHIASVLDGGLPALGVLSSSWSWSVACRSRSSATRTISPLENG